MANESDGLKYEIKANLIDLAHHLELVSEFFNAQIIVRGKEGNHITYRPQTYNEILKKTNPNLKVATNSSHIYGKAIDFHVEGMHGEKGCEKARQKILKANKLEEWNMRMEDNKHLGPPNRKGTWIHLDRMPLEPGGNRFFKP